MCCIHNLHERLSIIFIQSINLLVFPLPPVSYPPALISCCRFRLSACSCLSFCLVLRRKITAECLELWGWRRCARWPVFKMHARPPQLGRASPLSVVEIRQAGRQAGWENPQCSFILLCCLFLTLLALSASLYRNSGTEAPPPSQWFQPMINCKDTRLPSFHHPPTPPRSFFFFLGASVSHNHPKT